MKKLLLVVIALLSVSSARQKPKPWAPFQNNVFYGSISLQVGPNVYVHKIERPYTDENGNRFEPEL